MNKLSIEHFNKRITRQDLCNKRTEKKTEKECVREAPHSELMHPMLVSAPSVL